MKTLEKNLEKNTKFRASSKKFREKAEGKATEIYGRNTSKKRIVYVTTIFCCSGTRTGQKLREKATATTNASFLSNGVKSRGPYVLLCYS